MLCVTVRLGALGSVLLLACLGALGGVSTAQAQQVTVGVPPAPGAAVVVAPPPPGADVLVVPPPPGAVVVVAQPPELVPPPPPATYWSATGPSQQAMDYETPPVGYPSQAAAARPASNGVLRVFAEIGGWLLSYGVILGVTFALVDSHADAGVLIGEVLVGYFLVMPTFVWGAGNLAGGHGSLGWTMLGNAILTVFGAIGGYELSHAQAVDAAPIASLAGAPALALGGGAGRTIPLGGVTFAF